MTEQFLASFLLVFTERGRLACRGGYGRYFDSASCCVSRLLHQVDFLLFSLFNSLGGKMLSCGKLEQRGKAQMTQNHNKPVNRLQSDLLYSPIPRSTANNRGGSSREVGHFCGDY